MVVFSQKVRWREWGVGFTMKAALFYSKSYCLGVARLPLNVQCFLARLAPNRLRDGMRKKNTRTLGATPRQDILRWEMWTFWRNSNIQYGILKIFDSFNQKRAREKSNFFLWIHGQKSGIRKEYFWREKCHENRVIILGKKRKRKKRNHENIVFSKKVGLSFATYYPPHCEKEKNHQTHFT